MTNKATEEDVELEIVNLDVLKDRPKQSPWKRARQLEKEKTAEFLTPQDIYNKIERFDNPRDRCLFVLLYLTAGRIEELVRYTKRKYKKKQVLLIKNGKSSKRDIADYKNVKILGKFDSIKKSDFTIQKHGSTDVLVIRMRNLKNPQRGQDVKLIPIPLNDEMNIKFKKFIDTYLAGLFNDSELFPITHRRAEIIISKAEFNPHFLRKCRLTHLVRYYNFTDQKLKTFAGWSDSRPAQHYIRITWKDLVDSMIN